VTDERFEGLFRKEALRFASTPSSSALLRLESRWIPWCFTCIVAAVATALVFSIFGRISEYAIGVGFVRVEGRTDVTARFPANISTVLVHPGQRVQAGDPVVQLDVEDQRGELQRLQREMDLDLLKVLRDPTDESARQSLTTLRAQRDLANTRLEQRQIKAHTDGVVIDVRIRPGQHVESGDILLSLVPPHATHSVLALLPGGFRPMLRPGATMRFELEAYRYVYRQLVIESVADQVVGPAEARRFLGPEAGDAVQLNGPVVVVKARIPSSQFVFENRSYDYYDGLRGTAEVRVRSERILLSLIPALRWILPHD
jgi:membrane fusion protein (multidrug efflux system)